MKRILILAITASLFTACKDAATETTAKTEKTEAKPIYLGEKITEDGAMPSDSLLAMMGSNTELACKLSGKIDAVCQKKGCWMELKNTDGSAMRVTFKDYGFFMPKDCAGKTAIVDGMAKVEVTSVADLQEYAKDDGKIKKRLQPSLNLRKNWCLKPKVLF
ncbi:hypothetical protein EMGBS15_18840 [Filimonas sp.]|nr:hypothetical protein EMGBS15_18840 [Filimonas sp.]